MTSVGIVDCGRARWKVSVWTQGASGMSPDRVASASFELGENIASGSLAAAEEASRFLAEHHVQRSSAIGGEALRSTPDLVPRIESILGVSPQPLSPAREAELLVAAVSRAVDPLPNAVCDIGGGSIQVASTDLAWTFSLPLGTYAVEREYGLAMSSTQAGVWGATMRLQAKISRSVASACQATTLAVGSNQMASFLRSSRAALGVADAGGAAESTTPPELEDLLNTLACLGPDESSRFFPSNPGFMYGARQALGLVLAIGSTLESDAFIFTDLSISHGLALELLANRGLA